MSGLEKNSCRNSKLRLEDSKFVHSTARLKDFADPDFPDIMVYDKKKFLKRWFKFSVLNHWIWDFVPGMLTAIFWMWFMSRSFGIVSLSALLVPLIPTGIIGIGVFILNWSPRNRGSYVKIK